MDVQGQLYFAFQGNVFMYVHIDEYFFSYITKNTVVLGNNY